MVGLFDIPPEIRHQIFVRVEPEDLGRLAASCRDLNTFIREDALLWRLQFLRHYDHPHRRAQEAAWSWEQELKRFVRTKKLLESQIATDKLAAFDFIASCIIDLLDDVAISSSSSRNLSFLSQHFKENDATKCNLDIFLCGSSLFGRSTSLEQRAKPTHVQRQMSAKLHSLYGVPMGSKRRAQPCPYALTIENNSLIITRATSRTLEAVFAETEPDEEEDEQPLPTHQYARAVVYNLRNYTDGSLWGPFTEDGSRMVDWEKIEAVMVDLVYNMRTLHDRSEGLIGPWWGLDGAWIGATKDSYAPKVKPPVEPIMEWEHPINPSIPRTVLDQCSRERDPYGITGTWNRVVCFLDYTDFFAYNFGINRPRRSSTLQPLDVDEATRFISMELCATQIEAPGPDDGQDLPVVHFVGTSRSMHDRWDAHANSKIKGTVRLTPEGEVHWTTISIFHDDEERWRSEGIQVGGLRSGRGVLGNWFDKDYDPRGPAGPTAFWKISDEVAGLDVDSAPPSPA